jgi:MFS transporter, DHA1 family, multidrug resistance protein
VEFFLVGYLVEVVRLNLFSVGVITGSQIVALIIARPLIGRISDRVGRRIPIILGSLVSCLLLLLFPFTTQFPILLLLSVGYGISFATVISSTSPLVSELVPQRLVGSSLGFLSTIMDVGQTAGPIISGLIFASSLHYVGLFSSLSVLLLFSCSIFALSKPRKIDTDSIPIKTDS